MVTHASAKLSLQSVSAFTKKCTTQFSVGSALLNFSEPALRDTAQLDMRCFCSYYRYASSTPVRKTSREPRCSSFRCFSCYCSSRRASRVRRSARRTACASASASFDDDDDDGDADGLRECTRRQKLRLIVVPGFLRGWRDYEGMRGSVETHVEGLLSDRRVRDDKTEVEVEVVVAKIEREMWYRPTIRGESLREILDCIESAANDGNDAKIVLIGHSAGGWVSRLWMGGRGVKYDGKLYEGWEKNVRCLVTLGTPHESAEAYPFGRVRERRRRENAKFEGEFEDESSLEETRRLYPGCFLKDVRYVTVCGKGFLGRPFDVSDFFWFSSDDDKEEDNGPPDWSRLFDEVKHGISYRTDCETASADGDGVTCLQSGLGLGDDAVKIEIEGCKHEKANNTTGAFDDIWYGDVVCIQKWFPASLLDALIDS